jgi:ABC-type molybdate transport system substrate-binding protein
VQPRTRSNHDADLFAAASLADAFKEIGAQYEAAHPDVKIDFNFAG